MENKIRILLVEDDENLGYVLKDFLEMKNFHVIWQKNGLDGFAAFKLGKFNLCLLDVMMPLKDGFTLAREIRELDTCIPIVFLTAKEMLDDKIRGFKTGADDYVTKPFSTEELLLRIEAILRRTQQRGADSEKAIPQIFNVGNFIFETDSHKLKISNKEYLLTKKESELLAMLCLYQDKVLRRDIALKKIWGDDDYFMGRSMDVYITKLRKYLKDDPRISIVNVHGTGFKLEISH